MIDRVVLALALLLPVYFVWRYAKWGFWLGVLSAWLPLFVAGKILNCLDPEGRSALAGGIFLLFGWLAAALYCFLLLLAKLLLFHLFKAIADRHERQA